MNGTKISKNTPQIIPECICLVTILCTGRMPAAELLNLPKNGKYRMIENGTTKKTNMDPFESAFRNVAFWRYPTANAVMKRRVARVGKSNKFMKPATPRIIERIRRVD